MKKNKLFLWLQLSVVVFSLSLTNIAYGTEMDVDVGIEFTEIETELPIKEPPIVDKQDPPIKKGVQLPQTGERNKQNISLIGSLLLISAGVCIFKKKSGGVEK